jgi:hypothetical protein
MFASPVLGQRPTNGDPTHPEARTVSFPSPSTNIVRNSPHRLFLRQPSSSFDEMVSSSQFQAMKVMLDDISVFVSTQPEIQSRLRGELIDQVMRHEHNLLTKRMRPTTRSIAN